jgi:geranylgeranyl diphosphate synthase type II
MNIKGYISDKKNLVDSFLRDYFRESFKPSILHEAMTYSLFAGGKRIRPILAIASYEACGGKAEDILPQASALELIHTYSLIHDDLPAMDNDDLRRGKPTNHKVFGEAIAILAGDALLTEAFVMITSNKSKKVKQGNLLKAIRELAISAGSYGMVAGQVQDLLSENAKPDKRTLEFIHTHKTASLLSVSVKIGGILADADCNKLRALTKYGRNIGLAFQIIDDILDIEGDTKILGKLTGSDIKKDKMTYPLLYGIERAREEADKLVKNAVDSLYIFNNSADILKGLAIYILERKG